MEDVGRGMKVVFSARYCLLVSLGINQIRSVEGGIQSVGKSLCLLNQSSQIQPTHVVCLAAECQTTGL